MRSRFRSAGMLAAVFTLAAMSPRASALQVDVVNSNAGRVAFATVTRHGDTVYVTGSVHRGSDPHIGSHVDVRWLNRAGNVIASKKEPVVIAGRPWMTPTTRFTVGFPASAVSEAARVRVSYSRAPHLFCPKR